MQDPHFTDLDKSFLETTGYEVVEDPKAFELISDGTLCYAMHCYRKVLWKVTDTASPTVLICTNLREFLLDTVNAPSNTTPTAQSPQEVGDQHEYIVENPAKIRSMLQGYDEIPFPQLKNDFSDTIIYWRRSGLSDSAAKDSATASVTE
jgi:hypothetical protein